MINRVLIRIKVIQLLYSYLLTEKEFVLEDAPEQPTKEKRFAYKSYLDTLFIIKEIAKRLAVRGAGHPLEQTRFARILANEDKLRPLQVQYESASDEMNRLIDNLTVKVKEEGLYKLFVKKDNPTNADDVAFWRGVLENIVYPSAGYKSMLEKRESYSLRSMERLTELIDKTFTNFLTSQDHLSDGLKALKTSMEQARKLYFMLLILPVELTDLRMREIDDAVHKYLPTNEDLNPNLRFVENSLVDTIRNNKTIWQYVEDNKLSWNDVDPHLLEILLKEIKESEVYAAYMNAPSADRHTDTEFWREIYKKVIFRSEDFLESLEDRSIFWNDDIDIIGTFLLKTLKRIEEDASEPVLPMFKDEEDSRFGSELFTLTMKHREEYRRMIEDFIRKESWDVDRMAFMDLVIIETALCEILNFPKIPVKVSINEYVEIAKAYSTSKSGSFVNGILGAMITHLKEEKRLIKN